jgi:hypothetical protein
MAPEKLSWNKAESGLHIQFTIRSQMVISGQDVTAFLCRGVAQAHQMEQTWLE